jgi:hypothetical protein
MGNNDQKEETMKRFILCIICCAYFSLLSGCVSYTAPVKPPRGGLFESYKMPLTVNVNGNPCGPSVTKHSKSQTFFIWDILFTRVQVAWDDATISKIAREGEIEEISYADYEFLNVLGIFAKFTVNVYGN